MTASMVIPETLEQGTVSSADLVRIARTFLKVPMVLQGQSRDGVCCGGLFVAIAQEAGLLDKDFRVPPYSTYPRRDEFTTLLDEFCFEVPIGQVRAADLYLMKLRVTGAYHIGMRTELPDGRPGLIHVYPNTQLRRVAEHGLDDNWRTQIETAYRFRGLIE